MSIFSYYLALLGHDFTRLVSGRSHPGPCSSLFTLSPLDEHYTMTLSMDVQSSDSNNNNNNNNIKSIDNGVRRDIPWEELAAKLKGSIQIAGGEE